MDFGKAVLISLMIAHFIPSVDFLQEKEPLQPKVGFDKFKMFEDSSRR